MWIRIAILANYLSAFKTIKISLFFFSTSHILPPLQSLMKSSNDYVTKSFCNQLFLRNRCRFQIRYNRKVIVLSHLLSSGKSHHMLEFLQFIPYTKFTLRYAVKRTSYNITKFHFSTINNKVLQYFLNYKSIPFHQMI